MVIENVLILMLILSFVELGVVVIGLFILIGKVQQLQRFIKREDDIMIMGQSILYKVIKGEEDPVDKFYRGYF